ncbi:TPA: sugar ABC transporter permease [Staphylococcus pseudintermedius]|uniref:sugar ABC transporter permease n=1 Tax=Staphylococcus pseudintermedius TaxID=283734 RepID=UPI000C707121|nr:sugar ABC transporter permease [Staphylococcus pseudintermedius]EGQ3482330.1 sugar ABC transporter permease [Staphylococcus pseudintermedius]EGQ3524025.1 sugar ABC transporter permease [Staphylococcus pseudintermedius]EGQ3598222.1 sugar ABC transporter permease [Staphylococcus pseudintermedius]EGQ3842111.1 sugar ABC transporter permease [Staphylococcus pseudintermedius]EGQ4075109.1 sugar ABC transporter permease [Staphylococcus pseudintermedius]
MNQKKKVWQAIGIYGFIAFMFVVILYPLLWTFGISLNPGTTLYGAKMIPDNATFANYIYLLTDENSQYLTWYKNTLLVASANALFSVIFVTLTSYAFSRYRFVGRKYGLITFLILQMFPVLMAMVAIYILLNTIGLLDSLLGLTLVYIGGSIPMNAFLVKGYFDTIPKELDESAKIDGASHMRIFFQIMLPLAKPILAVVALFNFMGPFMDFILPKILLRSPEKYTLAVGLFNFINHQYANNFTVFAAGAIMIALPISIVFLFLQKYLVSGLTAGATKG